MSEYEEDWFQEWESQLVSDTAVSEALPSTDEASYKQELVSEARSLGNQIALKCVDLELERGRQYHELPFTGKKLRVIAEYVRDKEKKPMHLRLTSNWVTDIKLYLYSVSVQDFRFRFASSGISVSSGEVMVDRSPADLGESTPPIIWLGTDGIMHRFGGKEYRLGIPHAISSLSDATQAETRLNDMKNLFSICKLLSRDVSLEDEYSYRPQ